VRQRLGIRDAGEPTACRSGGFRSGRSAEAVIGLDTNVLARYSVRDESDAEADQGLQRLIGGRVAR